MGLPVKQKLSIEHNYNRNEHAVMCFSIHTICFCISAVNTSLIVQFNCCEYLTIHTMSSLSMTTTQDDCTSIYMHIQVVPLNAGYLFYRYNFLHLPFDTLMILLQCVEVTSWSPDSGPWTGLLTRLVNATMAISVSSCLLAWHLDAQFPQLLGGQKSPAHIISYKSGNPCGF